MSVLQKTHELTQVEWKVVDIFADVEDENFKCFVSPTFNFADATWRLLLAGKFLSCPESTSLILMRNEHRNCSLEYTFGLKKVDGSVERLDRGIMKDDQKRSEHRFIRLSDVLQQREELAPSGIVTITCTLRLDAYMLNGPNSEEPSQPRVKKLKRFDILSQHFKDLYRDKIGCDTILRVCDKEFQAHKIILSARSKVFAAMFQHETTEKKTGIITIPDCDPESFPKFLEYMYTGQIENLSINSAHHMFATAEKYCILELRNFCREFLMENLTVENWFDVICMSDMYSDEKLFSAAQDYFNKNANKVFQTVEWEQLMKNNYVLANKLLREMPIIKTEE